MRRRRIPVRKLAAEILELLSREWPRWRLNAAGGPPVVRVTARALARELRADPRAVARALGLLDRWGAIFILERRRGRGASSASYVVLLPRELVNSGRQKRSRFC